MPKYGFMRSDDDGHDYIIPEHLIENYDAGLDQFGNPITDEEFGEVWWEYAEGGSLSHYKVLMEE